jgi:chemotaxis protein CheX
MIDLEQLLKSATHDVFATMLNTQVDFGSPELQIEPGPFTAGTVGFTGKFNALIYVHTNRAFARTMTCKLLGLTDSMIEGQEMVNDVMGEMTNMHAGHMKSRLCDSGMPCSITIPTVVCGQDFHIQRVSGAQRHAIGVRANGKSLVMLELLVKIA